MGPMELFRSTIIFSPAWNATELPDTFLTGHRIVCFVPWATAKHAQIQLPVLSVMLVFPLIMHSTVCHVPSATASHARMQLPVHFVLLDTTTPMPRLAFNVSSPAALTAQLQTRTIALIAISLWDTTTMQRPGNAVLSAGMGWLWVGMKAVMMEIRMTWTGAHQVVLLNQDLAAVESHPCVISMLMQLWASSVKAWRMRA